MSGKKSNYEHNPLNHVKSPKPYNSIVKLFFYKIIKVISWGIVTMKV